MNDTNQSDMPEEVGLPVPEVTTQPLLLPHQEEVPPSSTSIMRPSDGNSKADETDYRWKFAEETHKYIREYIGMADKKAVFFFAASTAMLAYLNSEGFVNYWIKPPTDWRLIDMLSLIATFGLSISALFSMATVYPRMKGSRRSIVFFGGIAECGDEKDYVAEVTRQSIADIIERKLRHVYELASICDRKYRSLKVGLVSGAIGVGATVLLLLVQ